MSHAVELSVDTIKWLLGLVIALFAGLTKRELSRIWKQIEELKVRGDKVDTHIASCSNNASSNLRFKALENDINEIKHQSEINRQEQRERDKELFKKIDMIMFSLNSSDTQTIRKAIREELNQ